MLNGTASSGKSSIIKELQERAPFPLLKAGIDHFITMIPHSYYGWGKNAHEGIQFIREEAPQGTVTQIRNGPFGRALLHMIPHAVALMARENMNVVCDEVLFYDYYLEKYTEAFKGLKAYFVGVHCDLEELIRREQKRGGVCPGLGRDQISRVHGPTRYYDLEVDTTRKSSAECADQILTYIANNPHPQGFHKLSLAFQEMKLKQNTSQS
jgi:chloramphenicol 3-O phosphotransferase